jgi:hypothetical protein
VSSAPAELAVALSFFDAGAGLHGTIRSGLTVLFDGREARIEHEAAEISRDGETWRARAGGDIEVALTTVSDTADLGGVGVTICSVEGRVGSRQISGLGTAAETHRPPEWQQLDLLRAISAVFEPGLGALAIARRPHAAEEHGSELVTAVLIEGGELRAPEDARISTVYDGGGRQRSAGLELWIPGEEFARRGSGLVLAGSSLELDGVRVHAAIFRWRLDGRDATGAYELMVRSEPPTAA